MSLNGLDAADINDAYRSLLANSSGWFLLKYATRDEVELFRSGSGNYTEARSALAEYEEKSPVYGFIYHHNRKVMVTYLPEGTSRLLHARLTVHSESVAERFQHDVLLSISDVAELNETLLSSSTSSKTCGSVNSRESSNSLHQLPEIVEDMEEASGVEGTKEDAKDAGSYTKALEERHENSVAALTAPDGTAPVMREDVEMAVGRDVPNSPYLQGTQPDQSSSLGFPEDMQPATESDFDGSLLSHRERPSTSDLSGGYAYKPKIKLGPRPAADMGRARAPSSNSVSTLPSGVRISSRSQAAPSRPSSSSSSSTHFRGENGRFPLISSPASVMPPSSLERPTSRAGSGAILHPNSHHPETNISATSPEKLRLMKALELRKKQLLKRDASEEAVILPAGELSNHQALEAWNREEAMGNADEGGVGVEEADLIHASPGELDIESGPGVDIPSTMSNSERSEAESTQSSSVAAPEKQHMTSEATDISTDVVSPSALEKPLEKPLEIRVEQSDPAERQPWIEPDSHLPSSSLATDGIPLPNRLSQSTILAVAKEKDDALQASSLSPGPTTWPLESPQLQSALKVLTEPQQIEIGNSASRSSPSPGEDSDRPATPVSGVPKEPSPIIIAVEESLQTNSSSGESLLKDLRPATVEQAQPMTVSKSLTTAMPTQPSSESESAAQEKSPQRGRSPLLEEPISRPKFPSAAGATMRSVSNPIDQLAYKNTFSVGKSISRSPSTASTMSAPDLQKKLGVSSSISQRIKAFEKFSSSGPPQTSTSGSGVGSSTLVHTRKTSLSTPPSPPSMDARRSARGPYPTPSPSPHSPFVARRFGTQKAAADDVNPFSPAPAKAKGPSTPLPLHTSASEASSIDSTPSPKVDQPHSSFLSRMMPSKSSSKSSTRSPTRSNDDHDRTTSPSRNSFSSRRSSHSRHNSVDTVRPPSLQSSDDQGSVDGEKKQSKTRGLLKRMSASFSPRRSNTHSLSPPLSDQPIIESKEPEVEKPEARIIPLGELNVQFPDTLLWKRRNVEIDGDGYLVLAPSRFDKSSRIGTKKYHLSDFRPPYIPDQDREELPYSVIFDFNDTSTLQCACENSVDQRGVLQSLLAVHQAFNSAAASQ